MFPGGLGFSCTAGAEFRAAINTAHIPRDNFQLQPVGYIPLVHCELLHFVDFIRMTALGRSLPVTTGSERPKAAGKPSPGKRARDCA